MAIDINKDKLLLEQDYLSMTEGLEKIFLKKFKKSKKHLAENDKKSTEEEIEEYKAGRLFSWDLFMNPQNEQ